MHRVAFAVDDIDAALAISDRHSSDILVMLAQELKK
jgi:hypothetical protein